MLVRRGQAARAEGDAGSGHQVRLVQDQCFDLEPFVTLTTSSLSTGGSPILKSDCNYTKGHHPPQKSSTMATVSCKAPTETWPAYGCITAPMRICLMLCVASIISSSVRGCLSFTVAHRRRSSRPCEMRDRTPIKTPWKTAMGALTCHLLRIEHTCGSGASPA